MTPPLVSVVTVCWNSAATIEQTLRSVAAQVGPVVEHILIDGGSTDGTLAIIDRFRAQAGSPISTVVSEPDRGIYDAMNKGIALARGEVIALLNADDVYSRSDVLQTVCQALSPSSSGRGGASGGGGSLDAVYGDVSFFRETDDGERQFVRRFNSGRFRPDRIGWGWMPAHPALFFHRRVYQIYGVYRPDYRIAGDFEYVARVFGGTQGRATVRSVYLPEVLVFMQMGGLSTSGWRTTVKANQEVLRACHENGIPSNMLKILSKYPAKLLEFLRRRTAS